MRHYDAISNRLVYLTGAAAPDDWDNRWSKVAFPDLFSGNRNGWLVSQTRAYLPQGALILEGGCGCGDKVHSLCRAGYRAIGFDTASKTLSRAREVCPELAVGVGDIRKLPLANGSLDGYWSLGVFEHFVDGMTPQWLEAARVLRSGGVLFLTMPTLSPLRRLKALLGMYPPLQEFSPERFYQYAYSPQEIIKLASESGFHLIYSRYLDGVKGLKDEVPWLRPLLQRLYDSKSLLARLSSRILDMVCRSFSGHIGYFVFSRISIENPKGIDR